MIGNVASPVNYAQTSSGVPTANFRLATTERRYDRARGEWVDGDTNWVTVIAWRRLATNVVSSLSKGEPVVVSGRLRVREWEDEGKRRTAVEVDARVVGHDLGRGTSAFRWAVHARGEGEPQAAGLASAGEAVPDWIARAVREYRRSKGGGEAQGALAAGELGDGSESEAAGPVLLPPGAVGVTVGAGRMAGSSSVAASGAPGEPVEGAAAPKRRAPAARGARSPADSTAGPVAGPSESSVEGGVGVERRPVEPFPEEVVGAVLTG
ncbi:single-stranded DNA-binding protein [Streptomyces tateyamensis]|nr:single-stranded DNA-binding protein [Streptomyces tateyamensis]